MADYLAVLILNLVGVPGAFIAGDLRQHNKIRFVFGTLIAILGQAYVYLAYIAFIVNWTLLARSVQKVSIIVWIFAVLASLIPIYFNWARAAKEAKEDNYTNAQIKALPFTILASLIALTVFLINPKIMGAIYWWVPYMRP